MTVIGCVLSLALQGQGDFLSEKPRSGEGISTFFERLEVASKYKKEFVQLNHGKFGPNESLLLGINYLVDRKWVSAPKEEWRDYVIFGEDYRKVKIIDHSLDGAIFYLVSGHGGPDPGAVGSEGERQLCEDEYAYDVTLRLARWLIERDALVYFITRDDNDGIRDGRHLPCDKDEYCYLDGAIPRRHLSRLKQRTNVVNKLSKKYPRSQYQRMVSVHVDSRSQREQVDVFFYYHHKSSRGKAVAQDVYETFEKNYKTFQPNRRYRGSIQPSNALYVLKSTQPPAILIELGNIESQRDQRRLLLSENRQALAKWIGEGLAKNFEATGD